MDYGIRLLSVHTCKEGKTLMHRYRITLPVSLRRTAIKAAKTSQSKYIQPFSRAPNIKPFTAVDIYAPLPHSAQVCVHNSLPFNITLGNVDNRSNLF
jgi:hypothetical protein